MKNYLLFIPLLVFTSCSPKLVKNDNNSASYDELTLVEQFVSLVKNDDRKKLSGKVLYPLPRTHPLLPVADKQDFLNRYDEILDADFRQMIVSSDPVKDWESVGAKGIMFNRGKLWLDFSGSLFAVNHQSEAEKAQIAEIMIGQNLDLHESVRVYEKAILELKTKSYQVRIDNLGSYNYRYTAWSINKDTKEEPDLILKEGQKHYEGSGGNSRYEFKNGKYRYEVFIIRLGANDSPPAILNVYEGDKKIVSEDAVFFKG